MAALQLTATSMERYVKKEMALGAPSGVTVPVESAGASLPDLLTQYLQELDAADARSWRSSNVWVSRAIQFLKDAASRAERSVVPIDPSEPYDEDARLEIETLLEKPNPTLQNDSFGGLWGASIEDVQTINHGCVLKIPYANPEELGFAPNQPAALKTVDGSKVTQLKDWETRTDGYRYEVDMGRGKPPAKLRNNQLIVMDASPVSYSDRGIAPMKVLRRFLLAELATFKRMHLVQVQATPGGVFMVPGANAGTPDALAEEYEANIQGNAGVVFMNIPAESRYVEIGAVDLEKQGSFTFYEVIVRGLATAFGVPPMVLGWYADVNKAYGEVAQDMSYEGVNNLLRLIRFYINTEIVSEWGDRAANLRFTFDQLETEDETEAADSLRTKAGTKDFIKVSELRTSAGLEAIEFGAEGSPPEGVKPFINELLVRTPVRSGPGTIVMDLPVSYFFRFAGIDPDTMEFLPGSPFNPLADAEESPPPPEGGTTPELTGSGALLPGVMEPEQLEQVQKRLTVIRKALETGKNDDETIDELAGINELLEQNFRQYVPSDVENDEPETVPAGTE